MKTPEPQDSLQELIDREDLAQVGDWVKNLNEDEPSFAWRADLNAKLEAMAPKPRRRWAWPVWGTAVGMAAICAVVFLTPNRPQPAMPADLDGLTANAIVDAHVETVARHDLGLSMSADLKADRGTPEASYELDVVDLSAL